MGLNRTSVIASEKITTKHIFQKISCGRGDIADVQGTLHHSAAQLWRQAYKNTCCEIRRKLGNDIGDDLRVLISEIGLQPLYRQSCKSCPDGFLNKLRLNALFKHRVCFVLWQCFAQQTFKTLGCFRDRRTFGKGVFELLYKMFEIKRRNGFKRSGMTGELAQIVRIEMLEET